MISEPKVGIDRPVYKGISPSTVLKLKYVFTLIFLACEEIQSDSLVFCVTELADSQCITFDLFQMIFLYRFDLLMVNLGTMDHHVNKYLLR